MNIILRLNGRWGSLIAQITAFSCVIDWVFNPVLIPEIRSEDWHVYMQFIYATGLFS